MKPSSKAATGERAQAAAGAPRPALAEGGVPDVGDVNLAPLRGIVLALQELGVSPTDVLAEVGLEPGLFERFDARCDLARLSRLLDTCVRLTGAPHFGLLAGGHFRLPMMGLLGHLVANEPTVGAALGRLIESLALHDRAGSVALHEFDGRVGLSYGIAVPGAVAMGAVDDVSLMVGVRILQALCGRDFKPLQVDVAHRRPQRAGVYEQRFTAPARFDAAQSMIVFRRDWLSAPVQGADPVLLNTLRAVAERLQPRDTVSLSERARRLARNRVLQAECDADTLAALLGLSGRTLRRQLSSEGTRARALLAEVRFTVARQLLEDTRLSIDDVAASLHYSHPSAFSRAFRQWTGTAPSRWRRR